uniref:Nibrin n=1 Tax=Takifugu rubripes TaxID=31033 RepID=A0A674PMN2_TAKRU
MWVLAPLQPGGQTHYLHPGKDYVVGRKNCDILLTSDQSISRAHAQLVPSAQALILKDSSKYGTFINSQRMTENTAVNLNPGDSVTFGVFESKFIVEHVQPVVCSSCLDNNGKTLLSQSLAALGGDLVNSWSLECTHLVMTSVKVTVKTISALLCCRPIVKPEFFSELSRCVQQKLPPPKAERFIPEIDEPSLIKEDVNVGVIPGRRQLFNGKTFLFLTAKQLKRLSAAVSFGGGRSQLLEEGSLPRHLLESPQSCVIDVTTGSSQALLPPSTTEWAKSVRNIVHRKGLRVITESEIGLAAIYASCGQHCNPSQLAANSEPVLKVHPRIVSASLSQSAAVDETVLLAASQNITAYAVNTETSQGTQQSKVWEGTVVGETPEKRENRSTCRPHASNTAVQKTTAHLIADNKRPFTAEQADRHSKQPESSVAGPGSSTSRVQPSLPVTNGGSKRFLGTPSPQKPKASAQVSPQKQSTLTSFFQPVSKKRPLLDEPFMSEPKRATLDSSISFQAQDASDSRKPPLDSAADLFPEQSAGQRDRISLSVQEEPNKRKREKQEEENIEMDELESIMSVDMDFDDELPAVKSQEAQPLTQSSHEKTCGVDTEGASSASKRQRLYCEGDGTDRRRQHDVKNENKSETPERHRSSLKTKESPPLEHSSTHQESSKRPQSSSSTTHTNTKASEDIEDLELLIADDWQPKEETKRPVKAVAIKQEVQEAPIDQDLPKKLVVVEFRTLTLTEAPEVKPLRMPDTSCEKNFKCFRKHFGPGARGSPHIISGSDLLVHNRGKNSDLDEWLKDVVEEEGFGSSGIVYFIFFQNFHLQKHFFFFFFDT